MGFKIVNLARYTVEIPNKAISKAKLNRKAIGSLLTISSL